MPYLALFAAALILTACKSFQQENVIHRKRRLIPPTSYVFAGAELALLGAGVAVISEGSFLAGVAAMGTGAWMGCFISMGIHDRLSNG